MIQNQDLFQNYLEQQQLISLENARELQDGAFVQNLALSGNTNTNVNGAGFNLLQTYAASEHFAGQFTLDSTATVPSTTTIKVYLQGAPDNATWTNISELATTTFTGNASNVVANNQVIYRFSPDTPNYVRPVVQFGALGASPTGNIVFSIQF